MKMKGSATEMILVVGLILSTGVLMAQLKSVYTSEMKASQAEPLEAFANDLQSIIYRLNALTGDGKVVYRPPLKKYVLEIENNLVRITDKLSGKKIAFLVSGVKLRYTRVEDEKNIVLMKSGEEIIIPGACKEEGEECSSSLSCCLDSPFCWGQGKFTCQKECAPIGQPAADSRACCSKFLNETTGLCDERPCIDDGKCTPDECLHSCSDCYGPSDVCINDGVCSPELGENCLNSDDCKCEQGVCCPDDSDADDLGCTLNFGKGEGEECKCDSQCSDGLKCNPTYGNVGYSKACCPPGKSWNGKKCDEVKVYVVALVPAFYSESKLKNEWLPRAEFIKKILKEKTPFRENPSSLVVLIGKENCPLRYEDDTYTLLKCGNNLAKKHGYPGADLVGGILGKCAGKEGCGGLLGYTVPGQGWFIQGYDTCIAYGCPSIYDAITAPHEMGHNFRLCEGYCYIGHIGRIRKACYIEEKRSFGGFCGTRKVEQKFPYKRSATAGAPCGKCGPNVCCLGRLLTNDPVNPYDGGRDIMGPGQKNPKRAFACDSYLAFKDVAVSVYGFPLGEVTQEDIRKCYEHIKGDVYGE